MNLLTVVGICTYDPAVRRWLRTLRAHYDGPCLLYLLNADEPTRRFLADTYGCRVIDVQATPHYWTTDVPRGRMCKQWLRLSDACLNDVQTPLVLRTDVFDVVFQADPRDHLMPPPQKVLLAEESLAIESDRLNRGWVGRWLNFVRKGQVYNGGMVCGDVRAVAVLGRLIGSNALQTAIDQADLEVLAHALPGAFEYRHGLMENLYRTYHTRGALVNGKFVEKATGLPWCAVHGNGPAYRKLLEEHYPLVPEDLTRPWEAGG